ncbi:hypothetical protein HGRIS_003191 [Hohenbuehelia grisea]|uniref:Uncharacterized protein n=1 Tax=Hohenbuehelia grisea TaxID=104357 RepID=A0ABR3JP64_9AGAR
MSSIFSVDDLIGSTTLEEQGSSKATPWKEDSSQRISTSSPQPSHDDSPSLHDFLVSFKYQQLIIEPNNECGSRRARPVELAIPVEHQLEELVDLPALAEYAVDVAGEKPFRSHQLSSQELADLECGPRAHALNHPEIKCEGDSQHYYRGVFAFLVALALNILEPEKKFSAREGTIMPGNENIPYSLHATTDILYLPARAPVELKLPTCLDGYTGEKLFSKEPSHPVAWDTDANIPGGVYHVVWPGPKDSLTVHLQGVLQVYCQMVEENRLFGIISSYDHHAFVYRHPSHPKRLYISRVYASDTNSTTAKTSALYTSVCFVKVASDEKLRQTFHDRVDSVDHQLYRASYLLPPTIFSDVTRTSTNCLDVANWPKNPAANATSPPPNPMLRNPQRGSKTQAKKMIAVATAKDMASSTNSNMDNVTPGTIEANKAALASLRDERRRESKALLAKKYGPVMAAARLKGKTANKKDPRAAFKP